MDANTKVLLISTGPDGYGKTCRYLEKLIELIESAEGHDVLALREACSDDAIKALVKESE